MSSNLEPQPVGEHEVLSVDQLVKEYKVRAHLEGRVLRAVDDVTLTLEAGETLGVVGESGSGKTTLGRLIAGTLAPTSGRVITRRAPTENAPAARTTSAKAGGSANVQMVFQNPVESLNPRWTVARSVAEPLIRTRAAEREVAVAQALETVGLTTTHARRLPHQLSGGQQQRACIARAIIGHPSLVILDEAVSGLDVVLQQDVLALLADVQERTGMSYLFISHDLSAVTKISSRIVVMYLGKVVESAPARGAETATSFLHPYSVALHSAELHWTPDGGRPTPILLPGEPPSGIAKVSGCRFASRCPIAVDRCTEAEPPLIEHTTGHAVACYRAGELSDA